ncbi:cell division regulator GpsB [Companilactobacillus sp. DQM5]|uniref:cell division regulator GpsB n=1 Tax=Companilactobacillus sp. DQM5 TaxID=3463359 RepID=UPI0040582CB0
MNINTNLQPNDILNKEFHTKKIGGYNPDEVDEYLDNIIQDYDAMFKYIQQLEEENQKLRQQGSNPVAENTTTSEPTINTTVAPEPTPAVSSEATYNPVDESYPSTTNYDILRRLSNLERKVFGEEKSMQSPANDFYGNNTQNNLH